MDKTIKYNSVIEEMEQSILDCLLQLEHGYGQMKFGISRKTGIPEDILTVLLKRLKLEQKIELIMIWSEETGRPDGSGYCITGSLQKVLGIEKTNFKKLRNE